MTGMDLTRLSAQADTTRRAADTLKQQTDARDALILDARRAGVTWREIARSAGLTELAVRNAATRANGGTLPKPE